jgi:hypothetical protein
MRKRYPASGRDGDGISITTAVSSGQGWRTQRNSAKPGVRPPRAPPLPARGLATINQRQGRPAAVFARQARWRWTDRWKRRSTLSRSSFDGRLAAAGR